MKITYNIGQTIEMVQFGAMDDDKNTYRVGGLIHTEGGDTLRILSITQVEKFIMVKCFDTNNESVKVNLIFNNSGMQVGKTTLTR